MPPWENTRDRFPRQAFPFELTSQRSRSDPRQLYYTRAVPLPCFGSPALENTMSRKGRRLGLQSALPRIVDRPTEQPSHQPMFFQGWLYHSHNFLEQEWARLVLSAQRFRARANTQLLFRLCCFCDLPPMSFDRVVLPPESSSRRFGNSVLADSASAPSPMKSIAAAGDLVFISPSRA